MNVQPWPLYVPILLRGAQSQLTHTPCTEDVYRTYLRSAHGELVDDIFVSCAVGCRAALGVDGRRWGGGLRGGNRKLGTVVAVSWADRRNGERTFASFGGIRGEIEWFGDGWASGVVFHGAAFGERL